MGTSTVSVSMMILLLLMMTGVGIMAGLISGLLGVGGGIIVVPALYYTFSTLGYPESGLMHVAVATSLATIIFTSIRSVQNHHKKGAVDWEILWTWAPGMATGAVIGVIVAHFLGTRSLLLVFGIISFFISLQMGLGRISRYSTYTPPKGIIRLGWAAITGFFSALMGIGGGTFGVSILSFYGSSIHRAIATSAGFGLIIALPSTIGFIFSGIHSVDTPPFSLGYVNLLAMSFITPLSLLTVPLGAQWAHNMNVRRLRIVFSVFLALTSLNMLEKGLTIQESAIRETSSP